MFLLWGGKTQTSITYIRHKLCLTKTAIIVLITNNFFPWVYVEGMVNPKFHQGWEYVACKCLFIFDFIFKIQLRDKCYCWKFYSKRKCTEKSVLLLKITQFSGQVWGSKSGLLTLEFIILSFKSLLVWRTLNKWYCIVVDPAITLCFMLCQMTIFVIYKTTWHTVI